MAKKSKEHKDNRGNKEFNGSSSTLTSDQKTEHGKDFENEGGKWKPVQGNRMANAQNSQGMSLNEGQDSQGIDLPEITTTKKSCLPKLVVMLLPLVAIGVYWFFGS